MTIVVEEVPDCVIFDIDRKLSLAQAKLVLSAGARGVIRYAGLRGPDPDDIDKAEVSMWMGLGAGLMIVQHVLYEGWTPTGALGGQHGKVAADLLEACEYAPGATFWDDLEGMAVGTAAESAADYANVKFEALKGRGNPQGEYIGDDVPLTSSELFRKLKASIYWRSLSFVPDVATRGYAMRQLTTVKVGAIEMDLNWSTSDRQGARPMWMRAA